MPEPPHALLSVIPAKAGIQGRTGIVILCAWRQGLRKLASTGLVLLIAALTSSIHGAPAHADSTLDEMRAAAEKISSIKGDFIQEKHMPILARPLIAQGYFAYQRPASLRWEYRKPLQSVLLLHNGDVHRYLRNDKGWVEESASNMQSMDFILQEISNWLNGRFDENPLFNAAVVKDKTIVLTPKDKSMNQFIRRIELVMAERAGVMKSVTIFEGGDSFTRFTFVDPRINDPIPTTEFRKVQ